MQSSVSVVVPAKDRAHLLERSLASVAAQRLAPVEVVVVDDGSTDDTAGVARRCGATVIRLDVNEGIGRARNHGIRAATGEWIAFLDSDDEWSPGHLERLVARAGSHVLVAAPAISTSGRVLGNPYDHDVPLTSTSVLAPGDLVVTSGAMARRSALLEAGLFRPLPRAEDLDMWVRLLSLGTGLATGEVTVTYNEHAEQSIHDRELMRRCVEDVIAEAAGGALPAAADVDRARSRLVWDDLRSAQRGGDVRGAARHGAWLLRRPHTWRPLADVLRLRRESRQGGAAQRAAVLP
ncbi:glycosyltransferase family 2 protein [Kineococcus rubinsiae]|uniref:glycosyltransferase family 2 protein n=1 Tax=Kineococcus rubinsiae TaxID=2609562 RepID=UPI0014301CBB|nr:glycosyltransferase family 2 protein [Kineococcus rubinsiae]